MRSPRSTPPTRAAAPRDWLREAFGHLADLPATGGVLDREHSLVWSVPLGDDMCREILGYWRQTGPDGQPIRALDSSTLDTRFLGDLYQDLSELAKKKYALLQTPVFVEEFILDRTLTPALAEFGLPGLRLIDPTCGSGHFLLGAFDRLLAAWRDTRAGRTGRASACSRALDSVHGVDINPFAVAIARFRLRGRRPARGRRTPGSRTRPAYDLHLAVGDSLLGGRRPGRAVRRHRGGHRSTTATRTSTSTPASSTPAGTTWSSATRRTSRSRTRPSTRRTARSTRPATGSTR